MQIRLAYESDIPQIGVLLQQTLEVHYQGRPDLFKANTRKYNDEQLLEIVSDSNRPLFVAEENGVVLGYVLCVFQKYANHAILTAVKTMRIDDLCVDKRFRRRGIGKALYNFVLEFAKTLGCYNVCLNAWACNREALRFYESCGLRPQKIELEKIMKEEDKNE